MENTFQLTVTATGVNSKPIFLGFSSVTVDIKNAYLQESLWQSWHAQPFVNGFLNPASKFTGLRPIA